MISLSNLDIKPLYTGVKDGEFNKPIKLLNKEKGINLNKFDIGDDTIYLNYLMCKKNYKIVLSFTRFMNLEKNCIHKKKIPYNKHLQFYLENIKVHGKANKIKSFEDNSSLFKSDIFMYIIKIRDVINFDKAKLLNYQTRNFFETIVVAKTLLNKNALDSVFLCRIDRIVKFKASFKKLNIFLNQVYKNLSLLEQEHFFVWSGFVSFMHGMREFNDIDPHTYNYNLIIYKKISDFFEKVNKETNLEMDHILEEELKTMTNINNKKKIRRGRYIQVESLKYIIKSKKKVNNKTFNMQKIDKINIVEKLKYSDNLYFNPNCYSYFYGIKVTTILTDIYWRLVNSRPNQYAVLLAYNKLLNLNIEIPKIPKFKYECSAYYSLENDKKYYIMPTEKDYYMDIVNNIKDKELKKGIIGNIKKVDLDKKKFVNTIRFALRNKFNIKMTQTELMEKL